MNRIIFLVIVAVIIVIANALKKPDEGSFTDEHGVKYTGDKQRLVKAPSNLREYTIPAGVSEIQKGAFQGCSSLNRINLGTIYVIEASAFQDCNNLRSVVFPKHMGSIGECAFMNCGNLETISVSESVTKIGDRAFENCAKLRAVLLPDSISKIGDNAFANCDNLSKIIVSAEKLETFKKMLSPDVARLLVEKTDAELAALNTNSNQTTSNGNLAAKGRANQTGQKEKLMRPKFTDDEALAMGRLAVSLVGNRVNQPDAMIKFSQEFDGYTIGDIKKMTSFEMSDFVKSIGMFSMMADPIKKSYAAGFFAAIIMACGCENDPQVSLAYKNCLQQTLKMGGNGLQTVDAAAQWYEGFEHGKRV